MRMRFDQLFDIHKGRITPKVTVKVGAVTMNPGDPFPAAVQFNGVGPSVFVGRDFEVDVKDGVHIIKGVYK